MFTQTFCIDGREQELQFRFFNITDQQSLCIIRCEGWNPVIMGKTTTGGWTIISKTAPALADLEEELSRAISSYKASYASLPFEAVTEH